MVKQENQGQNKFESGVPAEVLKPEAERINRTDRLIQELVDRDILETSKSSMRQGSRAAEVLERMEKLNRSHDRPRLRELRNRSFENIENLLQQNGKEIEMREVVDRLEGSPPLVEALLDRMNYTDRIVIPGTTVEDKVYLQSSRENLSDQEQLVSLVAECLLETGRTHPKTGNIKEDLEGQDLETRRTGLLIRSLAEYIGADKQEYNEEFKWTVTRDITWDKNYMLENYGEQIAKLAAAHAEIFENRERFSLDETEEESPGPGENNLEKDGLESKGAAGDQGNLEIYDLVTGENQEVKDLEELEGMESIVDILGEELHYRNGDSLVISRFSGAAEGVKLLKDMDGNSAIKTEQPDGEYALVDMGEQLERFGGLPCYRVLNYGNSWDELKPGLREFYREIS